MSSPRVSGRPVAAVVPMTPLLFADLAGADDPLADLRACAVEAVRELAAAHDRLVAWCPAGAGAPAAYHHGGRTAPLSVLVAEHLCRLAGVAAPQVDGPVEGPVDGAGLLVVGDGSARHLEGGPGGLDPRAAAFDDRLATALATGHGQALEALDDDLAAALLVSGRSAFAALGRAHPRAQGQLRWRGAPYGVTYLVALWREA